jgi:hypothetical protein
LNEHPAFAHPDWFRRGAVRFWAVVVALCLGVSGLLHAQLTEEQKKQRDAFLKAREEMRTIASPTPSASPGAKPKPATKKGKKGASPTPKASPARDTRMTRRKAKSLQIPVRRSAAAPPRRPYARDKKARRCRRRGDARAATTPRATATPFELPAQRAVPTATPPPPSPRETEPVGQLPADITIEKSGLKKSRGWSRRRLHHRGVASSREYLAGVRRTTDI